MALLLEGQVDPRDEQIQDLTDEVEQLRGDLAVAEAKVKRAEQAAARAVGKLRGTLTPLYQSLQMLFGDMDAVAGEDSAAPGAPAAGKDPRWESWKQRLPGRPAEMIDLLLVHDSMTVKAFMAAMHCGRDSIYQAASKLGQAGVITNNGGRYQLKK